MRNRNIAAVRQLTLWAKTNEGSGKGANGGSSSPPLSSVHELRRVHVGHGLHDREGVLRGLYGLAVELAAVGLVVLLAASHRPPPGLRRLPGRRLRDLTRVRA